MGIGALKAVFLDRDGVLNRAVVRDGKPYPPGSLEELEILPGTAEALTELKGLGYLLIVVTNQPDVGRGTQSRESVEAMHQAMGRTLPVDEFVACYHDDRDGCACRKPLPGMLVDAAGRLGIDVAGSFMIGDRWRDIDAGHAAGCKAILIEYNYRERKPTAAPECRVQSLTEAVEWIKSQKRGST
ncbi:MAG TPA: HAD family hydrolase [Planctomycetaceae bacterium]